MSDMKTTDQIYTDDDYYLLMKKMDECMLTLGDQIRELKEEVEELQEMEDSTLFEKLYDSHLYEDWVEGSTVYLNMVEEKDEEIKALKEQLETDSGCEENAKLRKENETLKADLKEEKDMFQGCRECLIQNVNARKMDQSCIEDQKERIDVLKAEIQKLQSGDWY